MFFKALFHFGRIWIKNPYGFCFFLNVYCFFPSLSIYSSSLYLFLYGKKTFQFHNKVNKVGTHLSHVRGFSQTIYVQYKMVEKWDLVLGPRNPRDLGTPRISGSLGPSDLLQPQDLRNFGKWPLLLGNYF